MAVTNHERVGKGLELLRDGLKPFVDRELKAKHGSRWETEVKVALSDRKLGSGKGGPLRDTAVLLAVMDKLWGGVFGAVLGRSDRNLVLELTDVRNKWAHQDQFSSDDTDRALDSMARLLAAVSAPEADEVNKIKLELRRRVMDEQVRTDKRKAGGSLIETVGSTSLKPWRDVITPHPDVASGRYQQAEFAADLWQVHLNEGSDEYRKPSEFFRRTYLTQSLKRLLVNGVERVAGKGGDPVVQLQTNFGGGKTHSMLALYHLFSGESPSQLPGAEEVLAEAGIKALPAVRRVVLVGNKISPGNPVTKPDGTVVRTLWGELAYQLGGKKAYKRIQADDEKATSPGDVLRQLFKEYGPCLVLIDEWVAYARQLHDQGDLPAGGFETQFTFAQALTESAKAAGNCLLVISLPASDTTGSPHTQSDDVEVGGIRGREALDRLRNVVGRVESSWRPATAQEGFEIVRRRLFEPMAADGFRSRDLTARGFSELYQAKTGDFPNECREHDYEQRIQAAYPIHPEIFDRLYTDWSTLVKFQRTRGVLRLMAAVIHTLWEKGDRNPLILPSTIPLDDHRVQFELTRYLSDNWAPIIERDVDGSQSLPHKIDSENSNFGALHAARRVARTIFLGSAPSAGAAHRGLEDRRIKLGCVMPGESPPTFGDALRYLAAAATYLYQDGSRFWYGTQPTVTKLAEDRAEQLKRESDKVALELEQRLRAALAAPGDFARVHVLPRTSADVPDDMETRLVVLPPEHPYSKDPGNAAQKAAQNILESRGSTPRVFRNTLVFLAADKVRLQDLDEGIRRYLAWESILRDKEVLNLDPHQVRQAEQQRKSADGAVTARLPETFQYVLAPEQANPSAAVTWDALKLTSGHSLAERASKKLRSEELLIMTLGATVLRGQMDKVPLWRGDDVAVGQLVSDFATYLYLPRLAGPEVLLQSIRDGVGLLTWNPDSFAYAESRDEEAKRYRGLRGGQMVTVTSDGEGLLVKPEVAQRQLAAEVPGANAGGVPGTGSAGPAGSEPEGKGSTEEPEEAEAPAAPRRYHGTVRLDPSRVGRDAGRIAEEVIAHLTGLMKSKVRVTLEIEAEVPDGVPERVVRTVTENGRTLKFDNQGFEQE